MIRCPIDGTELSLLDESRLKSLNDAISVGGGNLRTRADAQVTTQVDAALHSHSGNWIYPIRNGILSLLADDAISTIAISNQPPS